MFHDPDKDFGFEGESREMSVLFSDIRGFTTLSEKLDPQGLKQFLNAYFTPITEIIFRKQGTIDKYVGDMVMAFWGAPLRDHAHAQNAVETALAMLDAMPKMREDFGARGWPEVDIGIGINTGPMNVGDMGSSFRRAYTVIGDAVNLGSRLESLTKYYGVRLLVSDSTRASELEAHEAALDAYFAGDWDAAAHRFSALASAFPERLVYGVFVERVAELRQTQAPGWDGVYAHTAK
jgi:adenylate cyclase